MKNRWQFLNGFMLKIIAIITMAFDHIGIFLIQYAKPNYSIDDPKFWGVPMSATGYVFRCIGRLALPIFCLLFAEAMRHSKSREKYFIRLGIMAFIVFIGEVILRFTLNMQFDGNIFITLLCAGTFIYFIEKRNNKIFFAIFPLLVIIFSTSACYYESFTGGVLLWWPNFLRGQYDLYGFLLMVGSYFIYYISDYRVLSITHEKEQTRDINELRTFPYYRSFSNVLWMILIIVVTFFFWLLARFDGRLDIYFMNVQSWAFFAAIIPLFYNGKKGYSSKKLQYGFYLYYPLHLVLLFVIFGSIFGFGG